LQMQHFTSFSLWKLAVFMSLLYSCQRPHVCMSCWQVEAVMQSVAAHRASVPAVISKALEQQLQDMRPPGCAAADDDAASPAGGAGRKAGDCQIHRAVLTCLCFAQAGTTAGRARV
jgi:hypothetical protein